MALLTLAADGTSPYVILVGPQANITERYAAEELQKYLARMTGATLPIAAETGDAPCIAVGDTAAAQPVTVSSRYEGDDGFRLRTAGANLVLKGVNARGTLYAVYAFLERLGCWWFAPAVPALQPHHEHVPHKPALTVGPLDVLEQPLLKYRKKDTDLPYTNYGKLPAAWPALLEWMGKNRCNTLAMGLREYETVRGQLKGEIVRRGLRLEVGKHDVTTEFLPPERYFAEHPEWFGMQNGRRTVHRLDQHPDRLVTFETASPEAVATFTRNLIDYLRQRPEIDGFQIWPPDGCAWSESPEALALGTPPERMALFVQHVAGAVRDAGLKTRIVFLAYASYIEPPRNMAFDKATLVDFCPIGRSYAVPLDDPDDPKNARYAAQLRQWAAKFPGEISRYSYYAKYSWRSLPVVLPEQIAHDIAYGHEVGEVGAGMYAEAGNWLALEVNHLGAALRLRKAIVAKAPPEELRPLQEAVRRLVDPHADDGTYLHVDWFYR